MMQYCEMNNHGLTFMYFLKTLANSYLQFWVHIARIDYFPNFSD